METWWVMALGTGSLRNVLFMLSSNLGISHLLRIHEKWRH